MKTQRVPQPGEWPAPLSSDQLLEHLGTAVFAIDLSGRFIHVNRAGSVLAGYPSHRLIGLHFERLFPAEQLPGIREQFARIAVRGESVTGYETTVLRKDGTPVDVGLRGAPLYDGKRIVAVVGVAEDISARKRMERQLARVERARTTLSACGHALARVGDERELLREVCQIIVETGGYRFAWVGYAESDTAQTVRPVASHGMEEDYVRKIKVTWADNDWGRGPVGTAIRMNAACVVQDAFNDTHFVPWRKEAERRGFASVAALPLLAEGQTFGALAIYAGERGAFDAEEVALLRELAGDLSYGIAALRTRIAHERSRRALRESEERFRAIFEHAGVGIAAIDREGRFVEVNARFCDMLRYSAAELLSKRFHDITHPEDLPGNLALRAAHMTPSTENHTYRLEKRYIRSDGEVVWVNVTSSPIRDATGQTCSHIGVIEDITQRKAAERALHARTNDLNERVKELHCLYAVSRIVQEVPIDSAGIPPALFQRIVKVIPAALRFVDQAAARLIIGSREFRTRSYRESAIAIRAVIHADAKPVGSLEICYVDPPAIERGAEYFLAEEQELLQVLAEQIGKLLERETASRVLQRERGLRDRLIEMSPAGILMLDRDGRITLANAQAEKVLGLTRQEIMHRAFNAPEWQITDWAGRPLPDERLPFRLVLTQGAPVYDVQHAIQWPDGRRVLLSVNAAPVFDEGRRIVAVIATVEDVTDRRQATERLRASEERFRNLIESTTDWVWETDRYGVYTYVSPQVRKLLGYDPDEVLGHAPFDFMPSEEAQRVRATFGAAVAQRKPLVGLENTNLRRDGRLVTLETSGVPFFDEGGELIGYRGMDRDITQRKQHEALLSDEKEILELIASSTPLEQVLDTIARAFERQSDGRMRCSILLKRDGALRVVAAPALPDSFKRLIEEHASTDPDSSFALAVARRQTALANELPARGKSAGRYRAAAAELGIRGICASPILSSDEMVLGVFAVYALACCWSGDCHTELGERAARLARIALEKAHTEERLAEMAYHDALTGLPNRSLLHDRLRQAMIEARRQERLLAVAYLDLDHFKRINDTLGHQVGDRLLVAVAHRLAESLRAGDTISRQGGDEFTLVLAGMAHVDDASRVARKIVESFKRPFVIDGRDLFITCSMGLTVFPFDGQDMEALLRNADAAMYFAKEEGRNSFQFYDKKMNAESFEHLVLENALRVALERDEFRLHYQPQVDSATGALIGVEALIRWQHPTLGVVTPARFIPLSEETGLILAIGEWVLRAACADAAAWQRQGYRLRVAVNLSGLQFRQGDLVEQVRRALEDAPLAPGFLELELTEGLLMQDVEKTIAALHALKDMGVSISVDDFGTGYSSLSYLRRFPLDTIKIDKSFIDGIAIDEESLTIVRTIIAMAHNLGKHVIAEGVETGDQVAALQREGCRRMQGYHFGRPVVADEILRLLETRRDADRAAGEKG